MKILIATPFFPPEVGGIASHVYNIARRLSKKHELIVAKNDHEYGTMMKDGITVVRILSKDLPRYPYQTLSSFRIPILTRELRRIIKNEKVDIIHSHGHHYPLTWLSIFYAKKCRAPTALTLHGMYALNPYVFGGQTLPEEVFNRTWLRTLLKRSDSIISLSRSIMNYVKRYGPKEAKYYVIPNGVDVNLYSKNLHRKMEYRAKHGLPQDKRVVLFRARFAHVKSVLESAYAVKSIAKSRQDIFCLFVGDGPLKHAVKEILSQTKNVRVLGWMPAEILHELYIASDIYLLPSKWEALPITLIEAMAARLRIVSTPVGGIPDVLEGYPLKVIINDSKPSTIFEALYKVCDDYDYDLKIVSEIEDYVKQFDWNVIASRVEHVYNEIAIPE